MIRFKLWYKNLFIGYLVYDKINQIFDRYPWTFTYSTDFIQQNIIKPLLDFPILVDENGLPKMYMSKQLFLFFKNRIPPPNRSGILQERTKKGIEDDDISMLIHFGHRCITDPFVLTFNPID